MKLFPLNKNSLSLSLVALIVLGFFIAGLFEILDYFIIKALLFLSLGALFILALVYAIKNDSKKNRPEAIPQDDSH